MTDKYNKISSKITRKRSVPSDDDTDAKRKNNYGRYAKMLIATEWAGIILGKGGETIVSLQEQTDCTITLSKANELFPGTLDRVCVINGNTANAVCDAFCRIVDIIALNTKINSIKFVVPNSFFMELSDDKEDSFIENVQTVHGVSVQLSEVIEKLMERIVTVTGDVKAIQSCCEEIIRNLSSTCFCNPYNFQHFNSIGEATSVNNGKTRYCIKFLLANISVGNVMGKGGETIGSIQKDTECRIVISGGNKYYPGSTDRVCVITGLSEKNVCNAFKLVLDYYFKKMIFCDTVEVKLLVPNDVATLVVGKEGINVKNLKEVHDVSIKLSEMSDILLERTVSISGNLQSVFLACKEIVSIISTHPSVIEQAAHVDYDVAVDNTGFSQIKTPDNQRIAYGSPDLSKFPFQFHTKRDGNPCTLPADLCGNLFYSLRSEGYSDVATNEIYASMATLAKYGIITYNASIPPPAPPLQSNQYPLMDETKIIVDSIKKIVKLEIQIPNIQVGVIIGNNGRTLAEIQQQTKAKIRITKKGDFVPGTTNRVVSILGVDSDVQQARQLIYYHIEDAYLKRNIK